MKQNNKNKTAITQEDGSGASLNYNYNEGEDEIPGVPEDREELSDQVLREDEAIMDEQTSFEGQNVEDIVKDDDPRAFLGSLTDEQASEAIDILQALGITPGLAIGDDVGITESELSGIESDEDEDLGDPMAYTAKNKTVEKKARSLGKKEKALYSRLKSAFKKKA